MSVIILDVVMDKAADSRITQLCTDLTRSLPQSGRSLHSRRTPLPGALAVTSPVHHKRSVLALQQLFVMEFDGS